MAEETAANPYKAHDFRDEANILKTDDQNLSLDDGSFPYSEYSREALFGYTPYQVNRDRTKVPSSDGETQEFVLDHGIDNYVDFDQDYTDTVDKIDGQRDMIKLIVEDIPTGKKVRFRSYLSDISDTITPEWSAVNYVGRPDQVHNYKQTTRTMSFTLKFAALSRTSMIPMYQKINYLYGLCYPHLTKGLPNQSVAETMTSPLVRLTMGDWCYKTPGYFSSINTTIDNDFPWDINLEEETIQTAQLPQVVSLGLAYTIIGDGPHLSAVQTAGTNKISGIHIGGGLSNNVANEKFFAQLPIESD